MIIQDPIRNALRELVREKRITGWSPRYDEITGETTWTVIPGRGTPYTTDEVNSLIAMFWEAA